MEPKAGANGCQEYTDKFLDLLDGNLAGGDLRSLENHLKTCRSCAKNWELYRATVATLNSLEKLQAPQTVLEGVRARIQRKSAFQRLLGWLTVHPWRVPAPAVAALGVLLLLGGLGQWRPWETRQQEPSRTASLQDSGVAIHEHQVQQAWRPYAQDNLLSPVKAVDPDLDWPLRGKVMIQDEMVLDLTGSEEVFQRIEGILRESRGKMFLMGVRHKASGQVVRSRILLEIPMESYSRVVQQIESIAPVQRVFLERDALPLRPDRLRISVVAVDMGISAEPPSIENVRAD